MEILRALGYADVGDQRSIHSLLQRLAETGQTSLDGTLTVEPCEGCALSFRLDGHGTVEALELALDSPEQTLSIYRFDEVNDGFLAHGFTCMDCLPIAPITVLGSSKPGDFEPRRCYFVRLSGIVREVEASKAQPGDMAFGQPDGRGFLTMLGVLASTRRVTNATTGSPVWLAEIALPGLVLTAVMPSHDLGPGQMVAARGRIHAVFSDPVP